MAHELAHDRAMFYVGETPWHSLGVSLATAPTIDQAIAAVPDMGANVAKVPLFLADGRMVPGAFSTVRETDGRILGGHVGNDYNVLQTRDAYSWFAPWLDSGAATLETGGLLRGGTRPWILAKLANGAREVTRGDEIASYILLSHSFDGSIACHAGITPVRVVCANTLAMAVGKGRSGSIFKVKHTKNMVDSLANVRESIEKIDARIGETVNAYRALAAKQVKGDDLREFVTRVFSPGKVDLGSILDATEAANRTAMVAEILDSPEQETKTRAYNLIQELFENGTGQDLAGARGTYWGAYNAVTEYTSHRMPGTDESRLDSMAYGRGADLNATALAVATQMAAR